MSQPATKTPTDWKKEGPFWAFTASFAGILWLLLDGLARAASHEHELAGFTVIAGVLGATVLVSGILMVLRAPAPEPPVDAEIIIPSTLPTTSELLMPRPADTTKELSSEGVVAGFAEAD